MGKGTSFTLCIKNPYLSISLSQHQMNIINMSSFDIKFYDNYYFYGKWKNRKSGRCRFHDISVYTFQCIFTILTLQNDKINAFLRGNKRWCFGQ